MILIITANIGFILFIQTVEKSLKGKILSLQEYRMAGITTKKG